MYTTHLSVLKDSIDLSFQKFKSDSFCAGGRHLSATTKNCRDLTSKGTNVLLRFCSKYNRKKSMNVSDNTNQAESPVDFFKNLVKKVLNVSKRWQDLFKQSNKSFRFYSKYCYSSSFWKS